MPALFYFALLAQALSHAVVDGRPGRRWAAGRPQHPAATPPPGSECRLDGAWIICHTSLVFTPVNEPILDFQLPCGTLYETATDVRRGIRWYDSSTGRLVTRFVTQDFEGTWSLSPTGAGPTVTVTAHANWRNVNIDADESTWRPPSTATGSRSGHRALG